VVSAGATVGDATAPSAPSTVGTVSTGPTVGAIRSDDREHQNHEDGRASAPTVHQSNEAAPIG